MLKALHPRDDIDRLYVSRKGEGRGFANIEDNVDASKWGLKDYIKRNKKKTLITATRNSIDKDKQNNNNWETEKGGKTTV